MKTVGHGAQDRARGTGEQEGGGTAYERFTELDICYSVWTATEPEREQ